MRWNILVGFFLAGLSLLSILFTSLPVPENTVTIPFSTAENEQGILTLTMPTWLKTGDIAKISLKVIFDHNPVASVEQQKMDLISRLEIGYIAVSPRGEGRVSINPNDAITFVWQIKSLIKSDFSGIVWLFVKGYDEEPRLILGRSIELTSRHFLGLTYKAARVFSIGGLILGIVLILPFIYRSIKKSCKLNLLM